MMTLQGIGCTAVLLSVIASAARAVEAIDIGSRLEPFVDEFLIDRLEGDARLFLHKPTPQEVVFVTDEPWEGNTCAYYTIFQDGDLYRMYYRGSHYVRAEAALPETKKAAHPEFACYAESTDGIHWTKPELGLVEFEGSKKNSIIWDGVGTHDFTAFKDANPDCPPEAKYKAFGRGKPTAAKGLYAFQSPDGIHWSLMREEAVITEGAFDSQNVGFWDPAAKLYREYHRTFRDGVRDIMTGTSEDFLNWTDPVHLEYPGAPKEHLYTNAIQPYERAPHILIGFPTRYLPDEGSRVEPTFMTSRDGLRFHRWTEAVIPESAPEDREGNRSNYMTWGLVQLPGDSEYSVYATEAYYTGPDSRVRRFTYRVDGFVSVWAQEKGGALTTKPITFTGRELVMNFATSDEGSVQVELQDERGDPIVGFTLDECPAIQGNAVEHIVTWKDGADVGRLAGRPVRLRFVMRNADLYSIRFR
jgi:hypothetical protein